jgi:hypothetical protein
MNNLNKYFTSSVASFLVASTLSVASASCGATECIVTNYSGTDTQKFAAAISDALLSTTPNVVYIPNGTYSVGSLDIPGDSSGNLNLTIRGQSDTGVVINHVPTIVGTAYGAPFVVDRPAQFNHVDLTFERFTLDMTAFRSLSDFTNPTNSTTPVTAAHGIRVGAGYRTGGMDFRELRINNSPGYGIGIQLKDSDKNADNVVIDRVHIENSGFDGIDTKSPSIDDGGRLNRNITILNLTVKEVGQNDTGAAAGLDLRYEDIYVRGYSFASDPTPNSSADGSPIDSDPQPVRTSGLVLRQFASAGDSVPAPANDGIIRQVHVTEGFSGVTFETGSSDVDFKLNLISGTTGYGLTVLNTDSMTLRSGCVYNWTGVGKFLLGNKNLTDLMADFYGPLCPTTSQVGSSYNKPF